MKFQSSICRSFHFKDPSFLENFITSRPVNLLEWKTSGSQQEKLTKLTFMEHHWNIFLGLEHDHHNWQKPSQSTKMEQKTGQTGQWFLQNHGTIWFGCDEFPWSHGAKREMNISKN